MKITYVIALLSFFMLSCRNSPDQARGGHSLAKAPPKGIYSDSLNDSAVTSWHQGNFQKALGYITAAYEKAKKEGNEIEMAKVLNNQGLVNWRLENANEAMACYDEAASIAVKHDMFKLLGLLHTNRALIYKEQKNFEKALWHNNQAIAIFRKHNLYRGLAIALNNQGQIFKKQRKDTKARAYYLEALENYKKENYKDGVAATYSNLADISLRANQQQPALRYVRKSVQLNLETQNRVQLNDSYKMLAEIYEHFQQPDSALKYFKVYNDLNTAQLIANQSDKLASYQANLGAELKNLQISNLQKERQLEQSRMWLIGTCAMGILLAGSFFAYRYLSKIRYRKRSLETELSTSKKIIDIKEQELRDYIIDLTNKTAAITKLQEKVSRSAREDKTDADMAGLLEQKILTEEDWEMFRGKFRAIYPLFFSRINQSKIILTEAEIRLIVLLCLNLSGKEMARTLGISPQSVRAGKLRLKKKLQGEGYGSVEEFIPLLIEESRHMAAFQKK